MLGAHKKQLLRAVLPSAMPKKGHIRWVAVLTVLAPDQARLDAAKLQLTKLQKFSRYLGRALR